MKKTVFDPEWITDKFIIIMLAIFPLWTGFSGYSNVTLSKYLFFIAAGGLWLALLAAGAAMSGKRPIIALGGWLTAALAVIACLSAVLSPYGSDAIIGAGRYDGLVSLLLYCCIFLGVSAYGRKKALYVWCLAFSVTVCCIVSLIQLLGYNALWLFPGDMDYFDHGIKYSAEFLGSIGNVDVFAELLCLSVPIFFGSYLSSADRRSAWLLPVGAFALFIALESGVSSAKVGLAAGITVGGILLLRKNRLVRFGIVGVIIAAAVLFSANITFTESGVFFCRTQTVQSSAESGDKGTAYEVKQILHGHFEDSYGSGRIGIWRQLLEVYPQRPIIGGGPGTVSDRIDIQYSRYVEETGNTLKTRVDNAHNEFLGYLMDEGALGLAVYAALIIATIVRFIKRRDTAASAIGSGLAGYWAQSFFGLGLCLVLPVIWLCWGLIWSVKDEKQHI